MAGTKRIFLLTLVGTIAFAAVLGIWVVLFGSFLGIDWQIWATLGTIFLFALPGLLAASMIERQHWRPVNRAAMVIGGVGTILFLIAVWTDPWGWLGVNNDWLWKSMGIAAVWAWALPWIAALGMTRFDTTALRAVRLGSMATTGALAAILSLMMLAEADDEAMVRLIGVLGILTALGTVATPILHAVFGTAAPSEIESTPLELTIRCPRCLLEQTVRNGKSRCRRCQLRFTIDIEEPRCPKCRYLLHGLTTPRCPECGEPLAGEEVAAKEPRP